MGALDVPAIFDPFVVYQGGIREMVERANPAVATDHTERMEGRYFTRVYSVFCRLVCDANVASREVVVEYRNDQALRYALHGAATTLTASQTGDYAFNVFQRTAEWTVDGSALVPLSPLVLPPMHDMRIRIVNAQAGDQLSRIRIYWERFYTDELR